MVTFYYTPKNQFCQVGKATQLNLDLFPKLSQNQDNNVIVLGNYRKLKIK